jgi:hypothetical protein
MITEDNIVSGAAQAMAGKDPFKITISIAEPNRTFWQWLTRQAVVKEKTLVFHPCKVGNMFRIAAKAVTLPKEITHGQQSEVLLPLFAEHLPTIIYIVAAAVQNNKHEPKPELIEFIRDNMDHDDLYTCMLYSLDNVGLDSFLSTIALAKGTIQVLKPKASPLDGSELIASHIHQLDQS